MGARGVASHGELNLSDGGGGDLPEVTGRGNTQSAEGLDSGVPKGRRREMRDRLKRGQLSGGPWGIIWLIRGGSEVAIHGDSATTSTTAQWR
jgi:hypothetical protein